MKNIPDVFREKIKASGLKQKTVAEKMGIQPTVLSAMLTKRRTIQATDFIKLCEILGLTMEDFEN